MALRALMKRKELDKLNKELDTLRANDFEAREADIASMIEEAESDEEREAVNEEIEKFEAEKEANATAIKELEERVAEIENELEEIEAVPEEEREEKKPHHEERKMEIMTAKNVFKDMDNMTRSAIFEREDVKSFLTEIRSAITEKRAISGGNLLVPEVFLGLIRENIMEYSKLYKHVNVRVIGGNGREVVMGTIPEAVWTDCCGNINELSLTFNDAEVGCWKVGGYFDICNATLQDSEIDLASEILTVLGQAIGIALDKAIIFGLGTRMPQGFFTRLAQTAAPSDYPSTARTWVDLHTTNIKAIATTVTGVDIFRDFVIKAAAAKGKYSRGEKVWVMNELTYAKLMAAAMSADLYGQIVTGVDGRMPVVGGIVEILPFIPDNMVFGGYLDLYLLAERAGTELTQSEHVHFLNDKTVFKGTARYDGLPVIAEGFVAIGLDGTTPSASGISFASDTANN